MQRISTKQKRAFIDARRQGRSITYAAKVADISHSSGRNLEKKFKTGELLREVRKAEQPEEDAALDEALEEALGELRRRGLSELPTRELVSLTSRLITTKKKTGGREKQEDDDIDQIMREIDQNNKGANYGN